MFEKRSNEFELVASIVTIFMGILLMAVPFGDLIGFLFVILGLFIIVTNLPSTLYYFIKANENKDYLPEAIISFVSVLIGSIFLFYHGTVLVIILACLLIIFPIVRIVLEKGNKLEAIKKELPVIIIGVLLCFSPAGQVFEIVVKVFGGLLIAFGIYKLVMAIINIKKDNGNNGNNNFTNNNKPKDYIDVDVKEV